MQTPLTRISPDRFTAFRDQDFADLPISDALKVGGYFGRHRKDPRALIIFQ